MKMHFFLSLAVLLLCACSSKQVVQPQAQIPVEIQEEKSENLFLIPSLQLQIRTSNQLRSDSAFSVIDTHTGKTAFHFELAPYLKNTDVDESSLPEASYLLRSKVDVIQKSHNCNMLQNESLGFVRVSSGRSFLCEIRKRSDGWTEIMLIGFRFKYESFDAPESALIILRENDGIVFSGLTDFPIIDASIRSLISAFEHQHPDIDLWSPQDPTWIVLSNNISALIKEAIEQPSTEVEKAMERLRVFGDSISFTTKL